MSVGIGATIRPYVEQYIDDSKRNRRNYPRYLPPNIAETRWVASEVYWVCRFDAARVALVMALNGQH